MNKINLLPKAINRDKKYRYCVTVLRLINFVSSLFTAITVRFLTKRYIGEYKSNTGKHKSYDNSMSKPRYNTEKAYENTCLPPPD